VTRAVWFNCAAGVAGDMTLGALVDAGADPVAVVDTIAALGLDGYAIHFERVQRCGVASTWANVVVHHDAHADHHHDHHDAHGHEHHDPHAEHENGHVPHRPVREILALLDAAPIAERVRGRARAVFVALAEVEGAIHGHDPLDVELHEVGAVDAIIDAVGVCAALESLDIDEVRCSPIAVGTGTVRAAHGTMPNPAPATIALLAAVGAPTVGLDTTLEVATPTGAALMTTLASGFGALPAMSTDAVGYGAGTADVAGRANVVQAVVGTVTDAGSTPGDAGSAVVLIEANIDDTTGEVLAASVDALLAAGAHDAWVTPIVMKKGRPAHVLSALCDPVAADAIRAVVVRESGTLGVRATDLRRWPQQRAEVVVDLDGLPVRVKLGAHRVKVEFDDAMAVAAATGAPVRTVIERAVAAASPEPPTSPPTD
jgi:uncharacterized protein (TIGR00299 family) protein